MPLEKIEDYPLSDTTKDYCVHCARSDGSMKSYEEALEGMTGFMVKTQGIDKNVARGMAATMMAKMPAWRDRQ